MTCSVVGAHFMKSDGQCGWTAHPHRSSLRNSRRTPPFPSERASQSLRISCFKVFHQTHRSQNSSRKSIRSPSKSAPHRIDGGLRGWGCARMKMSFDASFEPCFDLSFGTRPPASPLGSQNFPPHYHIYTVCGGGVRETKLDKRRQLPTNKTTSTIPHRVIDNYGGLSTRGSTTPRQPRCTLRNPIHECRQPQDQAGVWPRAFLARSSHPRSPRASQFPHTPRAFIARKCSGSPVSRVLAILVRWFSRVLARKIASPHAVLARRMASRGSCPSHGLAPRPRSVLARLSEGPSWGPPSRGSPALARRASRGAYWCFYRLGSRGQATAGNWLSRFGMLDFSKKLRTMPLDTQNPGRRLPCRSRLSTF
jgi:hypothetical protein